MDSASTPLLDAINDGCSFIWCFIFYIQLLASLIASTFLFFKSNIREASRHYTLVYFVPFSRAIVASATLAALWTFFTLWRPQKAIQSVQFLSIILSFFLGVSFALEGNTIGIGLGFPIIVFAVGLSYYCLYISKRMHHAYQFVTVCFRIVWPSRGILLYVAGTLCCAIVYSGLLMIGAGGFSKYSGGIFPTLIAIGLVLSMAYTMQVLHKYNVQNSAKQHEASPSSTRWGR